MKGHPLEQNLAEDRKEKEDPTRACLLYNVTYNVTYGTHNP